MNKTELIQKMMICVTTLCNLNGHMPDAAELYSALGDEYTEVLGEYLSDINPLRAAA